MPADSVTKVTVEDLRDAAKKRTALLLDVRESPEFAYERIEGTTNLPLSQLSNRATLLPKDKELYVFCQAGNSSVGATKALKDAGFEHVYHVEGGLEAWKRAGYQIYRGKGVIPIMRQVQIAAGALVLAGGLLPGFRWLAILVGAGLLFSGFSGTCMMAGLLSKMPWNKTPAG